MAVNPLKKIKFLSLAFFIVSSFAVLAEDGKEPLPDPSINVFLSLGDEHGFPQADAKESFDCSEQIFSVVKLHHYPEGKYNLTIDWLDPSSRHRERTEYPFSVPDPNIQPTTRLWSWIRLKRGAGAGLFQWINPTAGLEDLIGIWELKVAVNGDQVATQNFEVSC
jgi:hypothetical protein